MVGQSVCRRLHGFQNGHAGARQHGQGAGKAGGVVARGQPAHNGQTQKGRIKSNSQRCLLHGLVKGGPCQSQQQHKQPALIANKIAQSQHGHRQSWQFSLTARKHLRHLRYHGAQQKNHNDQCNETDDGGVERGTQEFGFERLLILQIVGQLRQHLAQVAALLACADDRGVQRRKLSRVLRHGFGQAQSRVYFCTQTGNEVGLLFRFGFIAQCG